MIKQPMHFDDKIQIHENSMRQLAVWPGWWLDCLNIPWHQIIAWADIICRCIIFPINAFLRPVIQAGSWLSIRFQNLFKRCWDGFLWRLIKSSSLFGPCWPTPPEDKLFCQFLSLFFDDFPFWIDVTVRKYWQPQIFLHIKGCSIDLWLYFFLSGGRDPPQCWSSFSTCSWHGISSWLSLHISIPPDIM